LTSSAAGSTADGEDLGGFFEVRLEGATASRAKSMSSASRRTLLNIGSVRS